MHILLPALASDPCPAAQTGTLETFFGCMAPVSSTVANLTLWANQYYIRGLQVGLVGTMPLSCPSMHAALPQPFLSARCARRRADTAAPRRVVLHERCRLQSASAVQAGLTDGRQVLYGCVNTSTVRGRASCPQHLSACVPLCKRSHASVKSRQSSPDETLAPRLCLLQGMPCGWRGPAQALSFSAAAAAAAAADTERRVSPALSHLACAQDPTFVRCQDTGVTNATFVFQPGETVTAMAMWPGGRDASDVRAGYLTFNTSLVRLFSMPFIVSTQDARA